MTLNIYLVRHGRTEWNVAGLLQGTGDSPLVWEGIENAKLTGKFLAEVPFDCCYSSMLQRAIDTANYIIGEREIPHFHHMGLNEISFGHWEGVKSLDLQNNDEYQHMKKQPQLYQARENQGEAYYDFYQRIMKTFAQIIERHKEGENILIVSHGMVLTLLTAVIKGLEWHQFRDESQHSFVQNTSVSIVKITSNEMQLTLFNHTDHIIKS